MSEAAAIAFILVIICAVFVFVWRLVFSKPARTRSSFFKPEADISGEIAHNNKSKSAYQRQGVWVVFAGVLLMVTGFGFLLIIGFLASDFDGSYFHNLPRILQFYIHIFPDETPLILIGLPGLILFVFGALTIYFARYLFTPTYSVADVKDEKNLLLYLRPFSIDMLPLTVNPLVIIFFSHFTPFFWSWMRLMISGKIRFEDALEEAFKDVGRLIAISDPQMNVSMTGADRILYKNTGVSKDKAKLFRFGLPMINLKIQSAESPVSAETEAEWKEVVLNFIHKSRKVIVNVGFSESIQWEIENVVRIKNPQDIILVVNKSPAFEMFTVAKSLREFKERLSFTLGKNDLLQTWHKFREVCGHLFPKDLPEVIGKSRLIRFDENWNAYPVKPAKKNIVWFIPQREPIPARHKTEGAVDWLSWFLVPEPFLRRLARHLFNYAVVFFSLWIWMIDYLPYSLATWNVERCIRWVMLYFLN